MPSFLARIAAISLRQPDLDVDAGGQVVQPLQRVDGLRRRLMDVDQPLVRADLEVLARVLVLERRADHAVHVLLGRQRHGPRHRRASARGRLDDLLGRRLDGRVVVRLQADADLVLGGGGHAAGGGARVLACGEGGLLRRSPPPCESYLPRNVREGGPLGPALRGTYSWISVTTPDPTVRPPSRMAKRRPGSMAIGWISSMSIWTLSPGI